MHQRCPLSSQRARVAVDVLAEIVESVRSARARRPHIPDYFLRTAQGGAIVVDIKPDD